ncbi:MAG: hypothetical protein DRJ30_07250 [Candidatus Methanomethylicota archaeon]|nr:MAG: hypothetical protein DRJ30_07250 [Candidatus Verstraetearchaeota archaeon]
MLKVCRIRNLGKVNILIGRNNCGKSSVLDAICMAKSVVNPDLLGERLPILLLQRRSIGRSIYTLRNFWHNYKINEIIKINLKFEHEEELDLEIKWENDNTFRVALIDPSGKIPARINGRYFSICRLKINGNFLGASGDHGALKKIPQIYHYLQNLILLDDYLARKLESLETGVFGPLLEPRLDKRIVEDLNKIYGMEAEGLTFIPASPTLPQSRTYRLATTLPKQSLHIDELGDGSKYAVALLSIALLLKDSALLIEEIESHQHIGAIKKLLPTLLEIAEERGLQLFITTHSYEVIQIFSQLSQKYDVKFFHLAKNNDGIISIREISGPDVKLLSDLGVDIRELEVYKRFFIVEGAEDVIFLKAIFQKYDKEVEDEGYLIPAGNKKQVKNVAVALTSTGKEIVAFIDYDKDSEEDILKSLGNILNGRNILFTQEENSFKISNSGSIITVIPLGLPGDETMTNLGITHHEMEDYCLKLIELDENVKSWLGITLNEIAESGKKANFKRLNKSKTYIQILANKKDMTYSEVIRGIITRARKENIEKIIGKIKTIIS